MTTRAQEIETRTGWRQRKQRQAARDRAFADEGGCRCVDVVVSKATLAKLAEKFAVVDDAGDDVGAIGIALSAVIDDLAKVGLSHQ